MAPTCCIPTYKADSWCLVLLPVFIVTTSTYTRTAFINSEALALRQSSLESIFGSLSSSPGVTLLGRPWSRVAWAVRLVFAFNIYVVVTKKTGLTAQATLLMVGQRE